jgi:hypothetical protein
LAIPQLYSLEEMRTANGDSFSDADYIHYVLKEIPIGAGWLSALVRFLCPAFEQIEDKLLLTPTGGPAKYRQYRREGKSPSEAQYWANLTEVSGIFENLNAERAINFASGIVAGGSQGQIVRVFPTCVQN